MHFPISIANKKIFNLIGSHNNIQKAIYDITLHLYSDDVKYKISKKFIHGLTVRFSEKNYKELFDSYKNNTQQQHENDKWDVLINHCYHISCEEIKDLNKYIHNISDEKVETYNLFVYPNPMNKMEDSCVHITCKCKKNDVLNMKEYYLSEKHDASKQFVRSLLYDKYIPNNNSSILLLPQGDRRKMLTQSLCQNQTVLHVQPDI